METETEAERKAWWSARRNRYNVSLLIAGPISGTILISTAWLFEDRLPCVEITIPNLIGWAFLFLVGIAVANLCYSLGPLSERLIRPRNAPVFRRRTYGMGVAFSLLLIFAPPIMMLCIAFFGPKECTDEFGQVHTIGAPSAPVGRR